MIEQVLNFECQGAHLIGILHQPEQLAANLGVVVVVGGPQYRVGSHRQFTLMARELAAAGYPVLRFDYRGMGDSAGEYRGFEHVDDDICAAIDALLDALPELDGVVLWGLCDAASACLIYGNRSDARVAGLILANPWVRTQSGEANAYLKHYYLRRLLQKSFWRKLFGGTFNVGRSLRELLGTVSRARTAGAGQGGGGHFIDRMLAGLERLDRPLLLLSSERDLTAREFADFVANEQSWQSCLKRSDVQLQTCRGADHTFSTRAELLQANEYCMQWLRRSRIAGS